MDLSSLVFVAIIGVWAAYLVPHWLSRRDDLAQSRTPDRFSGGLRVLQRRPRKNRQAAGHRSGDAVLTSPRVVVDADGEYLYIPADRALAARAERQAAEAEIALAVAAEVAILADDVADDEAAGEPQTPAADGAEVVEQADPDADHERADPDPVETDVVEPIAARTATEEAPFNRLLGQDDAPDAEPDRVEEVAASVLAESADPESPARPVLGEPSFGELTGSIPIVAAGGEDDRDEPFVPDRRPAAAMASERVTNPTPDTGRITRAAERPAPERPAPPPADAGRSTPATERPAAPHRAAPPRPPAPPKIAVSDPPPAEKTSVHVPSRTHTAPTSSRLATPVPAAPVSSTPEAEMPERPFDLEVAIGIARLAARRRAVIMALLFFTTVLSWVVAVTTSMSAWIAVPATGLLVLHVLASRVAGLRSRESLMMLAVQVHSAELVQARPQRQYAPRPQPAEEAAPDVAARASDRVARRAAAVGAETWEPVPVPPPTYSLKPAAHRPEPAPLEQPAATQTGAPAAAVSRGALPRRAADVERILALESHLDELFEEPKVVNG